MGPQVRTAGLALSCLYSKTVCEHSLALFIFNFCKLYTTARLLSASLFNSEMMPSSAQSSQVSSWIPLSPTVSKSCLLGEGPTALLCPSGPPLSTPRLECQPLTHFPNSPISSPHHSYNNLGKPPAQNFLLAFKGP